MLKLTTAFAAVTESLPIGLAIMTDNSKLPSRRQSKGEAISKLLEAFEKAGHRDEQGDYWLARELRPLLGYQTWQKFAPVIDKAKITCSTSGEAIDDHFIRVGKMVPIGSGAEREQEDLELTRFACYLIAQNGDSKKPEIAAAQTYFAVQTRRQELADQALASAPQLNDDQKRVFLRDKVTEHNKTLSGAARAAGVQTPAQFAAFGGAGLQGLYGGLDKSAIQRRKGLKPMQELLDHAGHEELAAHYFKATQTEAKLKREGAKGAAMANQAHHEVGAAVRKTIKKLGGVMPEDLPAEDHIKEARKRVKGSGPDKLA